MVSHVMGNDLSFQSSLHSYEHRSLQFFEQAAHDLAAYARHSDRNTINETDVECLMKRYGVRIRPNVVDSWET
jgi:histone H3/H4